MHDFTKTPLYNLTRKGSITVQDLQLAMTEQCQRPTCELGDVFSCFVGLHGEIADESGPTIQYSDFLAAMIHASLVPHQDLIRETFNRFPAVVISSVRY